MGICGSGVRRRLRLALALAGLVAGAFAAPAAADETRSWTGAIAGSTSGYDYGGPFSSTTRVEFREATTPIQTGVDGLQGWRWSMPFEWSGSFTGRCAGSGGGTASNYRVEMTSGAYPRQPVRYFLSGSTATGELGYATSDENCQNPRAELASAAWYPNYASPTSSAFDSLPVSLCGTQVYEENYDDAEFRSIARWQLTRLPDADHDGVPEGGELPVDLLQPCLPRAHDNCPEEFNPWQEDADGDGKGDACDLEPPVIQFPPDDVVVEEEGPVSFVVSATDSAGDVPFTCDPPSGSWFPVGTTIVTCTSRNAAGATTISFRVVVLGPGGDEEEEEPPATRCRTYEPTYRLHYSNADVFQYGLSIHYCWGGGGPVSIASARYQPSYVLSSEWSLIDTLWRMAGFEWRAPAGGAAQITARQDGSYVVSATPSTNFQLCYAIASLLPGASTLLGKVPLHKLPTSALTRQLTAIWTLLLTPMEQSFVTVPFDEIAQRLVSAGLGKHSDVCVPAWRPTIQVEIGADGAARTVDWPDSSDFSWLRVRTLVGPG